MHGRQSGMLMAEAGVGRRARYGLGRGTQKHAIGMNPRWANLHRATGSGSRRWYKSDPACAGSSLLMWCDEYPFYTSLEGGPGASLRLVPATEQTSQGGKLSAFSAACKVIAHDPREGAFGVVPGRMPTTTWTCK